MKFDRFLRDRGVITAEGCSRASHAVHAAMDDGVWTYGPAHRVLDPHHDPEFIRRKFRRFGRCCRYRTDAIRIAYGHVELDRAARRNPGAELPRLFRLTFAALRRKGLDRKRSSC
jgi:polysaccharide deacetylase 2 family uncharacterized protein YibQ